MREHDQYLKKIEHSENGSEGDVVWIQQEAVTVAQARDDGFHQNIDSENGKVEGFEFRGEVDRSCLWLVLEHESEGGWNCSDISALSSIMDYGPTHSHWDCWKRNKFVGGRTALHSQALNRSTFEGPAW